MKKRILALILTITCVFVACGGSDKDSDRERHHANRDDDTEVSVEAQASSEPSMEAEEPEETPAPKVDSSKFLVSKVNAFSSLDMDGNVVTEDIFKNADYTMINLWGTFCGPCINEMPELEEINKSLPDNIQIIGIVSDVYPDYQYSLEDAKDIISQTGVTYTNIMCTNELQNDFANLMYVPTTIFVDCEGNVVCEVIEGADIQSYKDQIELLKK